MISNHAERYKDGKCVICAKERAKRWYADNQKRVKETRKKYYENNKDSYLKNAKNRYLKMKPEIKEYKKNYYLKNKDTLAPAYKEYNKKHAQKIRECSKKWKDENPEKVRLNAVLYQSKRRSKIKSFNKITRDAILSLVKKQKNKCASCFCALKKYEVDHILPIKLGGAHSLDNLQILCPNCNRYKGSKHPLEWAKDNGKLL